MKANRAFELMVAREGIEPAFLADPERTDRVEVVSFDDGEVVLFWALPAKAAAKLLRELRTDLASLEAQDFLARCEGADANGMLPA